MDVALTPLEFARRTRALYPDRDALVDGALRLSYEQFFARCDQWSAALQGLGVAQRDRVAYIAPNTHAQLESFYAVPQIGAVLVPINYRLSPEEFAYIITHSGATVVCAHEDYLECLTTIRPQLPGVRHFIALEGRLRSDGASASQGRLRAAGTSASVKSGGARRTLGGASSASHSSGGWLDYETLVNEA